MRITRTLALTTAAALVAGAGLAAAVPAASAASAAKPKAKITITGTTTVTTAPGLAQTLLSEGIVVFALWPGTSSLANMKAQTAILQFPVTGFAKNQVRHSGGMLFSNVKAGGSIDCRTPLIDLGAKTVSCTLTGPTGADVTAPALKLTNISKPVVKKVGKVTTTTVKATISVNGPTIATVLNNALKTTKITGTTVLGTGVVVIRSTVS